MPKSSGRHDPDNRSAPNSGPISVSDLNKLARENLEATFPRVQVEGELSELLQHRSGHWYFTLKDDQAQLRCAMFRFQNRSVKFRPKDGQLVVLGGKLSLYEPRGSYQFIVTSMAPAGLGQLQQQFEQLKASLAARGFFDEERKQPLPIFPKQIAIITSPQGAAIRDIQTTFKRRFSGIGLIIVPVAVQGDDAAAGIADAIDNVNSWPELHSDGKGPFKPDAIIIGRGGGSLEDLWAFNEAVVAEAIHRSELPIVSAVGHETDFTIADFVADVRAATPTAAAELLSPDSDYFAAQIGHTGSQLERMIATKTENARTELNHLTSRLRHPSALLAKYSQALDHIDLRLQSIVHQELRLRSHTLARTHHKLLNQSPAITVRTQQARRVNLTERLSRSMQQLLISKRSDWAHSGDKLNLVSPLATLDRGYSITTNQRGRVVRKHNDVTEGDLIISQIGKGLIYSRVESTKE